MARKPGAARPQSAAGFVLALMRGYRAMASKPELSEIEQAVLEKYRRGGFTQNLKADVLPLDSKPETAAPNTAADARITLLPIQTGGAQRPIFYLHVHWIGGAGYSFSLARELGADQPL